MKKIIKTIQFVLLLCALPSAHAWNPFDSKLQMYKCKNQTDAMACSSACEKREGMKGEFKVSTDKSTVMWILYENGAIKGNNTIDNCKVVDAKNWACETQPDYRASSFYGGRQTMVNGQYFSWSVVKLAPIPSQGMKAHASEMFSCAK